MLAIFKSAPLRVILVLLVLCLGMITAVSLGGASSQKASAAPVASAPLAAPDNSVAQPLPFAQNWTTTTLITTNDDWSGVPGIEGFLGDDPTTATNIDPRTVFTPYVTLDVIANQSNPNTVTAGGVAEFDGIANPVVALQGSGTADFPYIAIYIDTTGLSNIRVQYNVRDIDGSADNAVQQVNLQYRIGNSGPFSNVPGGYITDATTGPSLATLVTPIDVILPAAADNQARVELRVMTTNAGGSDEWVGIDDINIAVGGATPTTTSTETPGGPTATDTPLPPTATPTLAPVPIRQIQAAQHRSPLEGQTVSNVPGIVTALQFNGFYMQDPTSDGNDATSEGIFVFTSTSPTGTVAIGNSVLVSGMVVEFRAGGATSANLTITEIGSPVVAVLSTGNPLPTPVVVGTGGRIPPNTIIEDQACGDVEGGGCVFDPATDGIDFYESMEGMRVQVNNPVAVGPRNGFGEIAVLGDDGVNGGVRTTRGGIIIQPNDFNPERIILDDVIMTTPPVNVSDHFSGPAVGVMDYGFGNFKLQITQALSGVSSGLTREVAATPAANQIVIGNFNVENLDPGDPASQFNNLAGLIVNNMKSPDIISIEEIQDNDGPGNAGTSTVVDATTTWNMLITAIQNAGGPTYQFRNVDPVDDQDGGEPGGNIRQGFLFRTDRGVAFIDRPGGCSTCANSVVGPPGAPELQYSPGRVEPTNTAFNSSRKPLAGEFTYNGHKLFLIGNHLNSKGGDHPLFGRFQPPVRSSEVQRHQQAQIINNFVDSILASNANANVVVLGDINDFYFSTTVNLIEGDAPSGRPSGGGVLQNLMETLPLPERYSYVFDGNSQDLDNTIVSSNLLAALAEFDPLHVNAEFANQDSDHDPQVSRYTLAGGATATTTATASATTTAVVTVVRPSAMDGWTLQNSHCTGGASTGSVTFVNGPATPPRGVGSVQFNIGTDGDSFIGVRNNVYSGTLLSSISMLNYSTFVQQEGSGGQAPYLNMLIDWDNNSTIDDQIFFEPVYNGTVITNTWQTWNTVPNGLWWSLNDPNFPPGFATPPWPNYIAAHPNARIVNSATGAGGLRIVAGCGGSAWANFIGNADDLTIGINGNNVAYDFEPDGATATPTNTAVPPTATMTTTTTGTATTTTTSTNTAIPPSATTTRTNTAVPPTATNTVVAPSATTTTTGTATAVATATCAPAQSLLLIPDWTNDRVMAFDPQDGHLVNANFIPTDATHLSSPKNAIMSAAGNTILVSDQIDDVVQEYALNGTWIRTFAPAGGANTAILDNILGIALRPNGNLLVTVTSGANQDTVAEFDTNGTYLGNFITAGSGGVDSPFDVLYRPVTNDYLVPAINSDIVHRYSSTGAFLNNFTTINNFAQQANLAANGNVLVANFSGTEVGVLEYTSAGTFVGRYSPVTGNRGVYELGNGNILTTDDSGVYEINRAGGLVGTELTGVNAQYIELVTLPAVGNCPTSTATTVPPTATNTVVAPTATNTVVPPTATRTNTAVASTATNTPVAPSATVTPVVPSSTVVPPTSTTIPSSTAVPSATSIPPTSTIAATSVPPTSTATTVPSSTPTACIMPFTDVDEYNPFYVYIKCLYCRGIISGYADNTFRPYAEITRGQMSKIVSNSAGFNEAVSGQTYTDVPPSHPFYVWIMRLSNRGIATGYNTAAQCPTGVPCFRPENSLTRGQMAKIDSNAAGFSDTPPAGTLTFTDVPPSHPFYIWIERLSRRGIINGYDCGVNPMEPCDSQDRPYYRPYANITRGQASKIVANTFFPVDCTPGIPPILPGR